MNHEIIKRPIRSFVRREGRMTKGQKACIDRYLPAYQIDCADAVVDWSDIFVQKGDVILEIGFGMGASLAQMARDNPDKNFIGVEVYRPGIGSLLAKIVELELVNIRIVENDVVVFLNTCVADNSVDKVQIFFPDPWPKARHHKRRLITAPFLLRLAAKLKSGGCLHVATDWQPYAEVVQQLLFDSPQFSLAEKDYLDQNMQRMVTKFESRGQKLGHAVIDLLYLKR